MQKTLKFVRLYGTLRADVHVMQVVMSRKVHSRFVILVGPKTRKLRSTTHDFCDFCAQHQIDSESR